jgi:two-component system OmpR family sensor kinase
MKLRTRLAILVGIVMIVGGGVIGGVSALVARQGAIKALDNTLGKAIDVVRLDSVGDVSKILDFAESSPVPMSAMLFYSDGEPVALVEGRVGNDNLTFPALSIKQVQKATIQSQSLTGSIGIRMSALQTSGDEWLVVGVSTYEVGSQFGAAFRRNIELSLLIAAAMVALVYWMIRRELRPVAQLTQDARAIAGGNLSVMLSKESGKNEIAQLTESLTTMVNSLRDAVEVTTRSEIRMREFLGDASHELRTPLTVIRGYVDILNSGNELSQEIHDRAMHRLTSESLRMSQTINDLLLLAELDEVNHDKVDGVDLSAMVADHVQDLTVQQPQRRVSSTVATDVRVQGNRELLERIFSNLMSNIARHTNTDADVGVSLVEREGSAILIVDDAGPGLSTEMYARSFEGFQRFDKAHSQSGGGFGLGLSILSSIVQRHGGVLTMSQSPLGGLRTIVTIPIEIDRPH